jgi:hypothetical protein
LRVTLSVVWNSAASARVRSEYDLMRAEMPYCVLRARFSKRSAASASTVRAAAPYNAAPIPAAKAQPTPQKIRREPVTAFSC